MPLDRNELEILAARFVLNKVEAQEIRDLADRLTSEGEDNPVLIDIYIGRRDATKEELRPYLHMFLESEGISLPSKQNAAVDLAYRYAKRATLGLIDYQTAAYKIDDLRCEPLQWDGTAVDFSDFDWLVIEWEDKPPDESAAETLTKKLVDDWESNNMRRWIPKPPVVRRGVRGFLGRSHGGPP